MLRRACRQGNRSGTALQSIYLWLLNFCVGLLCFALSCHLFVNKIYKLLNGGGALNTEHNLLGVPYYQKA